MAAGFPPSTTGAVVSDISCAYSEITRLPSQTTQLLGRTLGWAVYDAFAGFNPNSFAQIAGTVAAGGWLILITPSKTDWISYDDPEYHKLRVEPWTAGMLTPRYLARLVRLLEGDRSVVRLGNGALALPNWVHADSAIEPVQTRPPFMSPDQERVAGVLTGSIAKRRCAYVLSADRGRGKSAAIGLALAAMACGRPLRVLITAPSKSALSAVFERIESATGALQWNGESAQVGELEIVYLTPAEACQRLPSADLLVVDEAAAIATPLLKKLSGHYGRLIFATTQHGYEGNGRGFTLRFLDELKRLVPSVEELQMSTPVRWAEGDPLEQVVTRMLQLDAESEEPVVRGQIPLVVECLDRDRLVVDESLLRRLFGLLILAHYRTTPGDLRVMLDSPNLQIYVLRRGDELIGCALIAQEGPISEELARGVWEGHRRPTGHLLPQALIAHEGEICVAPWRGWRILRIAVHPAVQQQGMGSYLLRMIVEKAQDASVDYLGASFGATDALLGYWRRSGFLPVRVGDQEDPVSGCHSTLVLNPLSAQCRAWFSGMRARYAKRLRYRLNGTLSSVSIELLPSLFSELSLARLNNDDTSRLVGFARHKRSLESTLLEMDLLLLATVASWPDLGLASEDQALLVDRVWRQRDASEVKHPQGRNAQLERLRHLTARLLDALAD
ncbi:MAG: tRNA(Met) cytidine acetyltransferase [Oceanospirillales bacterium]|nr:tRNA(Met) cytidine acetyltransferase [Oceanospirillales bacterium]